MCPLHPSVAVLYVEYVVVLRHRWVGSLARSVRGRLARYVWHVRRVSRADVRIRHIHAIDVFLNRAVCDCVRVLSPPRPFGNFFDWLVQAIGERDRDLSRWRVSPSFYSSRKPSSRPRYSAAWLDRVSFALMDMPSHRSLVTVGAATTSRTSEYI